MGAAGHESLEDLLEGTAFDTNLDFKRFEMIREERGPDERRALEGVCIIFGSMEWVSFRAEIN